MGQQAVFRAEKQLSRRQAQLRGAEVGCGGGSVWAVWYVPGVWWGEDCVAPHPCLSFPISQLPVEEDRHPHRRKRWGEQARGEKEAGARGAGHRRG